MQVQQARETLRVHLDDGSHVDRPAAGIEVDIMPVDYLTKLVATAKGQDDIQRELMRKGLCKWKQTREQNFRSHLRAGALEDITAVLGKFLVDGPAAAGSAHTRNAISGEAGRKPSYRQALITLKLHDSFRKHCDTGGNNFLSPLCPSLTKEVSYFWAFQKIVGMECPAMVVDGHKIMDVQLYNLWLPRIC